MAARSSRSACSSARTGSCTLASAPGTSLHSARQSRASSWTSGRAPKHSPKKLRRQFRQLVRLVDHEGLRAGQDFAEAFLLQREVGEQQVVVDHDDVGRLRALARLHHEAVAPERAFGAQAVVGGGGDQRQQRRIVGQRFQFGQVAELGAPAPGDDALELRDCSRVVKRGSPLACSSR